MSASLKYITATKEQADSLSATAAALIIPLFIATDVNNQLHKHNFIRNAGLKLDPRTWNKYWKELQQKNVLRHVDGPIWMLSPNYGYSSSANNHSLLATWNNVGQEHASVS